MSAIDALEPLHTPITHSRGPSLVIPQIPLRADLASQVLSEHGRLQMRTTYLALPRQVYVACRIWRVSIVPCLNMLPGSRSTLL